MNDENVRRLRQLQCIAFLQDFVREWYDFGNSQKADIKKTAWHIVGNGKYIDTSRKYIYRFVAYWIAFTAFLDRNYGMDYKTTEIERVDLFFSDQRYNKLLSNMDLLEVQNADFFMKNTLHCMAHGNEVKEYKPDGLELSELYKNKDLKACNMVLVKLIYKVRNNLIHGQKRPDNEIDVGFVEASSNVMEKLIGELLKYNR